MTFAYAGRTDEKKIARLADEVPRRQFIETVPFDVRVERPVKVFERLHFPEAGDPGSPFDLVLIPEVQFILNEQLQEFLVAQAIAFRFLQPDFQTRSQSRKPKLPEHRFEIFRHGFCLLLKKRIR